MRKKESKINSHNLMSGSLWGKWGRGCHEGNSWPTKRESGSLFQSYFSSLVACLLDHNVNFLFVFSSERSLDCIEISKKMLKINKKLNNKTFLFTLNSAVLLFQLCLCGKMYNGRLFNDQNFEIWSLCYEMVMKEG